MKKTPSTRDGKTSLPPLLVSEKKTPTSVKPIVAMHSKAQPKMPIVKNPPDTTSQSERVATAAIKSRERDSHAKPTSNGTAVNSNKSSLPCRKIPKKTVQPAPAAKQPPRSSLSALPSSNPVRVRPIDAPRLTPLDYLLDPPKASLIVRKNSIESKTRHPSVIHHNVSHSSNRHDACNEQSQERLECISDQSIPIALLISQIVIEPLALGSCHNES